jgi:predicted phosphoribosyltransferase
MKRFYDRYEAGRVLARELRQYDQDPHVQVLGLPRGGVPVAFEISKALRVPLDVLIVRKLGVPGQEELAMGAISSGGVVFLNDSIVKSFQLPTLEIEEVIEREKKELERRERLYRGHASSPLIRGKTVILVDDGIATGATLRAAMMMLRKQQPAHLVVAVPVASFSSYEEMVRLADEVVCPLIPEDFYAVGAYYENFSQTTDEEVLSLLKRR